ncbi:protein of unknown function DUF202 [Thermodesulfobium narugense DSM 14796]|uniref:DUF202 domain-containing protein n=1 Tax=Thermodesulfobium narugense DSM 14796 TaxID=747365 RepID=M1E5N0_9BACT|nr:DUF202 domain-containing protein [Thermodesulfobium narugense]AEE15192.1 protein of unknown function DUF202 [Thermodesulfobium narugense DSM 14796]
MFSKTKRENNNEDARESMAAVRTLLSWIRTSLGLMAFSVLLDRFDLFVHYLGPSLGIPEERTLYLYWVAVVFAGLSFLTVIVGLIDYIVVKRRIGLGEYKSNAFIYVFYTLIVILVLGVLGYSVFIHR